MALGRNARGLKLDKCIVEPLARVVMLSPQYEASSYEWDKTHWDLWPDEDNFLEARDAMGDDGYYIGWAGGISTAWAAYLNSSTLIEADRGIVFNIYWQPPQANLAPYIELFPRLDLTRSAILNGYTYYFCPIIITLDAQATLTVYEYEYDTYSVFESNPAKLLTKTHQHSLLLSPAQLQRSWVSLTLIPIENDGFVLKSPHLEGGGFVYFSKIKRETVKMFPEGSAGIRSIYGGLSMFNLYPVDFETEGTVIGPPMSKREEDKRPVSISIDGWTPSGTGYVGIAINPETEEPIEVYTDEETEETYCDPFRDYTYKVTLTGNGKVSPVIYWVDASIEGEGEDKTPTDIDITSDVIVTEQTTEDLTGYSATVKLRNLNGVYNELLYRPINEIDFDVGGQDRAILYTLNPQFNWWQTPRQEALWIEWQCGDAWVRLQDILCGQEPAYDGLDLKTAVETFLLRQGFEASEISVHEDAADIILPEKRGSNDYIFKPEAGRPAADFLRDLHDNFCSTWVMYFDGQRVFHLEPVDTTPKRTYYLSHDEAVAAFAEDYAAWEAGELEEEPQQIDYTYFVLGSAQVRFNHEDFANEIWVLGWDDATKRPLAAVYLDVQSQIDEDYVFYTGSRQMIIVECPLINNQEVLQWICDQLAAYFGRIRRTISFKTKYDPTLRPTDLITFRGSDLMFRVASITTNIGPNTWGRNTGDIVDCTIEAIEWPVE